MIRFDGLLVLPVLWLVSFATWAAIAGHTWAALSASVLVVVLMWAGSRK